MIALDLSTKITMGDYILRFLSKRAKETDLDHWTAFFVENIVIKNPDSLSWIQTETKCKDMAKIYHTLRGATL